MSRLAEEPGHVYSWQHLGHALDDLGDGDGARAAWLRGIEAARRKAEASPADVLAYAALMHRELDRGADISSLLDEATVRFPDSPLVAWIRGRALMRRGRFAEALPILAALAAVDAETLVEDRLAYDVRIFGVWAVAGLALCCFRLGRYEESARHYARAEALAPEDRGHGVRRRLAEARGRRAAPSAAGTSVAAARA